ncbi:MAG: hypothetical protein ACKOX6_02780 [Bdellovibrio sp.]
MTKNILVLAIALFGQAALAGYVPPGGMVSCDVKGKNAAGQVFTFTGYGIQSVEACGNAMYYCNQNTAMVTCGDAGSYNVMSFDQQDQDAQ